MKTLLVVFWEKKSIWSNFIFFSHFSLLDWAWSKVSQATVIAGSLKSQDMIFLVITAGSLIIQDMISPINVYVMDIVWMSFDVYV